MESIAQLHQLSRDVQALERQLRDYVSLGQSIYTLLVALHTAAPDSYDLLKATKAEEALTEWYEDRWGQEGGFWPVLERLGHMLHRKAEGDLHITQT